MTRSDGMAVLLMGFSGGIVISLMIFFVFLLLNPKISSDDVLAAYQKGQADALKTNPPSDALERVCLGLWADRQPVRP